MAAHHHPPIPLPHLAHQVVFFYSGTTHSAWRPSHHLVLFIVEQPTPRCCPPPPTPIVFFYSGTTHSALRASTPLPGTALINHQQVELYKDLCGRHLAGCNHDNFTHHYGSTININGKKISLCMLKINRSFTLCITNASVRLYVCASVQMLQDFSIMLHQIFLKLCIKLSIHNG